MNVFEIKDMKAEGFNIPFFEMTRATAMRKIQLGLSENKMLLDFSQDFAIYDCGTWDPTDGRIKGLPDPIHVCDISELVASLRKEEENATD